jgi:hypothetical protein
VRTSVQATSSLVRIQIVTMTWFLYLFSRMRKWCVCECAVIHEAPQCG